MSPLNACEWLEAERIAGNPFAPELLDMLDEQDTAEDNADLVQWVKERIPEDVRERAEKPRQLYRIGEWLDERLDLLSEIEEILDGEQFEPEDGAPWPNTAEKLRDMLNSPRWQKHDL